jgi:hypothetical protein
MVLLMELLARRSMTIRDISLPTDDSFKEEGSSWDEKCISYTA